MLATANMRRTCGLSNISFSRAKIRAISGNLNNVLKACIAHKQVPRIKTRLENQIIVQTNNVTQRLGHFYRVTKLLSFGRHLISQFMGQKKIKGKI